MSEAAPIDPLEVNRGQLATLLGVDSATIRSAIEAGAPGVRARGGRGKGAKIYAPSFVQWWIERERQKITDRQRDGASLARQEQQLDIDLKADKLRRARSETIDRAAAVHVIKGIVTTCAQTIRQRRHGHRLVRLPDIVAVIETFDAIAEEQCADLRRPEAWEWLRSERAEPFVVPGGEKA